MKRSKEDRCSTCGPEMLLDEDYSGDWNGECQGCSEYSGDDVDLLSIFYKAEIWFPSGEDEDEGTV